MNYNYNCKFNNVVKICQPQLLQIKPIIYQRRNYMDPDTSIKFGGGGGSEEKRPNIQKVGLGQRRRGAMPSVQSKAMD
jgi:hypothetical protein